MTRLKICYFIRSLLLSICHDRYWIVEFPAEFNLDLGLIHLTEEFREVAAQLGYDEHIKLIDISSIPSYDWMRRVTQRKKQSKKGKASLLFDHLEPMELAEHLTFLEYKSFRRISFTDYQSYVIHGCLVDNATLERSIALFNGISQWVQLMVLSKPTPQHRAEVITKFIYVAQFTDYQSYVIHGCLVDNATLERSIALFNGISQWVQLMVLSKPTPQHRAEVITKFIYVAQKLLQLQNFNTLMAVVGGLSHSSISRLKETHSHLSPEVTKMWNEMTELVTSNGNYCTYRKAFADCEGFKIPILGVHLKDLIAMHVVFPDWIDEDKVNIVKMQQLYVTFNELVSLQSTNAQVEPNMDLIYLLTLSLDLYYTEDEIYELSLLREPRNPKSQPTSPTTPNKPVVPLDWASGVAPKQDPTVINKHIRKVVDSVFRNYDHDHDGYISQEDFESIAANFPFLDSFCVLDKDQDGLISKDEMMAFFVRGNSPLQYKMGPGFIHNFQEMTYLKPTFCEQCSGFLWGIIKQGYKCKDCGVNCHKQCKELLVLACRKLSRGTSLGSTSPSSCSHGSLPSSPSLPQCAVQDEVFKFPAVTGKRQDLDGRSITLMTGSARKISVRLQRATTSQATQTETMWHEQGWGVGGDSGSHTFPKMRYKLHGKSSKSKGFARWENAAPQAKPQTKEKGVTVSIAEQNGMDVQEEERQEPSEVSGAINWNI
ncbi:Ras guanyl-releasing protein 3 [Acipenser ruthenus]|uniref:Ras guanyl-releasing protein 3 n=1 Tax=Acipenser ruthenus TaxID=7906 RepID=A0A444U535_ACIRT|nr:Ras guanyl-releasing protein 3 [Acipenser ruthenus]